MPSFPSFYSRRNTPVPVRTDVKAQSPPVKSSQDRKASKYKSVSPAAFKDFDPRLGISPALMPDSPDNEQGSWSALPEDHKVTFVPCHQSSLDSQRSQPSRPSQCSQRSLLFRSPKLMSDGSHHDKRDSSADGVRGDSSPHGVAGVGAGAFTQDPTDEERVRELMRFHRGTWVLSPTLEASLAQATEMQAHPMSPIISSLVSGSDKPASDLRAAFRFPAPSDAAPQGSVSSHTLAKKRSMPALRLSRLPATEDGSIEPALHSAPPVLTFSYEAAGLGRRSPHGGGHSSHSRSETGILGPRAIGHRRKRSQSFFSSFRSRSRSGSLEKALGSPTGSIFSIASSSGSGSGSGSSLVGGVTGIGKGLVRSRRTGSLGKILTGEDEGFAEAIKADGPPVPLPIPSESARGSSPHRAGPPHFEPVNPRTAALRRPAQTIDSPRPNANCGSGEATKVTAEENVDGALPIVNILPPTPVLVYSPRVGRNARDGEEKSRRETACFDGKLAGDWADTVEVPIVGLEDAQRERESVRVEALSSSESPFRYSAFEQIHLKNEDAEERASDDDDDDDDGSSTDEDDEVNSAEDATIAVVSASPRLVGTSSPRSSSPRLVGISSPRASSPHLVGTSSPRASSPHLVGASSPRSPGMSTPTPSTTSTPAPTGFGFKMTAVKLSGAQKATMAAPAVSAKATPPLSEILAAHGNSPWSRSVPPPSTSISTLASSTSTALSSLPSLLSMSSWGSSLTASTSATSLTHSIVEDGEEDPFNAMLAKLNKPFNPPILGLDDPRSPATADHSDGYAATPKEGSASAGAGAGAGADFGANVGPATKDKPDPGLGLGIGLGGGLGLGLGLDFGEESMSKLPSIPCSSSREDEKENEPPTGYEAPISEQPQLSSLPSTRPPSFPPPHPPSADASNSVANESHASDGDVDPGYALGTLLMMSDASSSSSCSSDTTCADRSNRSSTVSTLTSCDDGRYVQSCDDGAESPDSCDDSQRGMPFAWDSCASLDVVGEETRYEIGWAM